MLQYMYSSSGLLLRGTLFHGLPSSQYCRRARRLPPRPQRAFQPGAHARIRRRNVLVVERIRVHTVIAAVVVELDQ